MKFTALIVGGCLAMAGAANAGTLWSQPFDGTGNAYSSQNDTSGGNGNFATAYDSFTLAGASNVNGIDWTGEYFNPATQGNITAFTLTLYADSAGAPGATIASGSFSGNANETSIGSFNGFPTFTYSVSLGNHSLAAGAYWVSIVPDLGFPPQWGWSSSAVGNGNAYQCFFGACGAIGGGGANLAFDVLGSAAVPEPGAWTLMLVGFGGLGLAARSRRRAAIAA